MNLRSSGILRSDAELDEANAIIRALISRPLVDNERDYLDVLEDLVEKYEAATIPIGHVSDADLIRSLLNDHDLTQGDLARLIGVADSTVSEVLNGKRDFAREQVGILCKHFSLRPDAFRFVD